ncbi:MAG: asparagine synthase (glutamine-hydrolyzing) [Rubritalea sp.]|uniref:asparagine synthase (glutamine-hydrolyzing) n=1 Tax=Rubritalea sp. TaxID=2109375 RepID=UPI003241FC49
MCGILYSARCSSREFEGALPLMAHRGPDAHGIIDLNDATFVGHQRLSILDLGTHSNQPFVSVDGNLVLSYNGEIYNFRELAAKYSLECRTHCDSEVLLLLYQKLGVQCLGELNGMFAFVVVDRRDGSVFAARDRLGVKPLYIDRRGMALAFASEIAPLLELNPSYEWDEEGLRQYVKLRTCFGSKTIYRGIEQLPAGSYYSNGVVKNFWELPEGGQEPPSDEELRFLVEDAVRLRMVSDVPVGSYLSGGLDSTIIAGLSGVEDVWSVGFTEKNEFEYAQLAADSFGLKHTPCVVDSVEFQSTAQDMIQKRREPLSVPNEVLIYLMTQQVKLKNTVVLSGEGADELFFGYDRIFRWAAGAAKFDLKQFDKLYSYGSHSDDEIVDSVLQSHLKVAKSTEDAVARFFQLDHLQGLLRRLDNSTMSASVEARVPFVDHRLIERFAGVSSDYRMADGVVKSPLKRLFSDIVPSRIIQRKKVGFPVPLEKIPFYDSSETGTVMDQWLKFNLRTLTGCDGLYQYIIKSP